MRYLHKMFETTVRGDTIKLTFEPCSDEKFYTAFWSNVYGVSLEGKQAVTKESIRQFAGGQAFSL